MIKKNIKICLFIIIGLLQVILMPLLAINNVWPNIILIIAIIFIISDEANDAFLLAGIGGIILDLTGNLRIGVNIIMLITIIFVLQIIVKKYYPTQSILLATVTIFCASILMSLLNLLFLNLKPGIEIITRATYAGALGFILYYFINEKITQKSTLIKIKTK